MRTNSLLVALALLCWTRSGGRADPCTMHIPVADGQAGTLLPRQNDDVRMVRQRVELVEPAPSVTPTGRWHYTPGDWMVRAHYVLENTTDRALELTVAFPMVPAERLARFDPDWDPEFDGCTEYETRPPLSADQFVVRVDGVVVPHQEMPQPERPPRERSEDEEDEEDGEDGDEADRDSAHEWSFPAYIFTVRFAPRARVELECEYPQPPSYELYPSTGDAHVPFILRTGRLWNGPIGSIEFVYRLATPSAKLRLEYLIFASNYGGERGDHDLTVGRGDVALWRSAAPFSYDLSCAGGRSVLTLRAENVEPDGDLVLLVPPLYERIAAVEARGCLTYSGWNAPADDCCEHLSGPTMVDRLLSGDGSAAPVSGAVRSSSP